MNTSVLLEFQKIEARQDYEIALITLNRPDKANALNEDMIHDLLDNFESVKKRSTCRLLILRGNGKHFCSGADLHWMKASAKMSYEENISDAQNLAKVFEALAEIPFPTIAVIHGNTAGGGLGLIACCDIGIASIESSFSLKEVRVGLLPAMIVPYLLDKIGRSSLVHFGLTAEAFSCEEALRVGLVNKIASQEQFSHVVREVVQEILKGGPQAQKEFKHLLRAFKNPRMQLTCTEAIAKARTGEEGQKGLSAILNKTKPYWVQTLPDDWAL